MARFLLPPAYVLLIGFTWLAAQTQRERSPGQLPAPTDIDPSLTEQLRQLEQEFGNAILHKDANTLERIVGSEFTLRVSDVPESSLPRSIWMDNTLHRLKAQSFAQRDDAARKLTDDLAALSLRFTGRTAHGASSSITPGATVNLRSCSVISGALQAIENMSANSHAGRMPDFRWVEAVTR